MNEVRKAESRTYAGRQQAVGLAEDADLTHVGPGTPCGEYLRRFWQPVAISSELGALPLNVRMLGEDLVLIRTGKGEVGLLGRHCCHRGTSLEYGIVTDEGISCCYHGWHFAVDGTILDTPNDPKSRVRQRLRQTAYPTEEYRGVIFAYLGPPEAVPAFPLLDTCEDPDTELVPFSIHYPCNWLQCLENTQDPVHSTFLHTRISGVQFAEAWGELAVLDFVETPIGMMTINVRRWKDNIWVRTNEATMPNMNQVPVLWQNAEEEKAFQRVSNTRWFRATDDTNTDWIGWRHFNDDVDPDGRGDRDRIGKHMIDVMGHSESERPYDERQRVPGDFEAITSQRPIAVHKLENLTRTDKGVTMLRRTIRRGIRAVQEGKPFASPSPQNGGVVPTYSQDTIVHMPATGGDDRALMRDVGAKVSQINLETASLPPRQRKEEFARRVREIT